MKTFLLSLLLPAVAAAQSVSTFSPASIPLTVPGGDYAISFGITWTCDDFPQNSAPGRIELLDSNGILVGGISASTYRGSGDAYSVSGSGSITSHSSWVNVYAPNGTPADGELSATWTLPGLAAGNYTVRLWSYTITLDVLPAITRLEAIITSPDGQQTAPVTEVKQASTIVRLHDGETAVIGGLISDESGETTRGIPVLGSLPGLGAAFRSKARLHSRTELVIFLTPKLIR